MDNSTFDREPEMTKRERVMLLDLVAAVQDSADNEAEVVATLRHMAETEQFRFESVCLEDHPWAA